jgi:hypothetical protein
VAQVRLGPEELEPLAQWVRSNGDQEFLGLQSLGLQAQQVLGRLFSVTFVATPASWAAATTLVKAPRSSNVPKLDLVGHKRQGEARKAATCGHGE